MNPRMVTDNNNSQWIECFYTGNNWNEALAEADRMFPNHRLQVICRPARNNNSQMGIW